jgi:hypothetical protein
VPIFLCQKSINLKYKYKKTVSNTFVRKAECKMLVTLTKGFITGNQSQTRTKIVIVKVVDAKPARWNKLGVTKVSLKIQPYF